MTMSGPPLYLARHTLPLQASLVRVLLQSSLLLVVASFPYATSGVELFEVTGSEAPFDQGESPAEDAIGVRTRTRTGHKQTETRFAVPASGGLSLATTVISSLPSSGHRLANNLLAPLRC